MKTPLTITEKIQKFESDLKALEVLGLEIIEEKISRIGKSNLSLLIFKNESNLTHALKRIEKGKEIKRSKISLIAEIIRRISTTRK